MNDLRAQVGQLLIMGFDGLEMSSKLRTSLETLQPGGVILFARNVQEPRQTWELLRECRRSTGTPMFLCVDMEGGSVDRLRNVVAPAPAVADVAAIISHAGPSAPAQSQMRRTRSVRNLFRQHGRLIGSEVRTLGFNTDFAPVVDLGLAASRPVLTSRTVSADPEETTRYAREFLRGLRDVRILGCGKHFPGLGEANLDTHKELPVVGKSWKRLWEEDLYPYRMLHREVAFIMVAHAAYPAVTHDKRPASLSRKWITDILRKKIGYGGLVVSDDLEMGGVLSAVDIGEAAVQTLQAGADIFLVCHKEEAVWQAYKSVLTEAERDRRFARRVAIAAQRVLAFKKQSAELRRRSPAPSEETVEKLRRRLWEFGEEVRLARLAEES